MEYTVQSLAQLAGVSARTLRYYDEIGLLKPTRKASTGYRIYGAKEVDKLQQILFYKALGIELDNIKSILEDKNFDNLKAMEEHLHNLEQEKQKINSLIDNVKNTISSLKGEIIMSDKQKFEAFKQNYIKENNEKYGEEVKEKYGEKEFAASNQKLKNASQEQWNAAQELSQQINLKLKEACLLNDPASEAAQEACKLHQQWIKFFWTSYSKQAHLGLCQMYTQDERFKEYYEKIYPGCTELLLKAMTIYLDI